MEDTEMNVFGALINNKIVEVKGLSSKYSLDNLASAIDDSIKGKVFKAYIEI